MFLRVTKKCIVQTVALYNKLSFSMMNVNTQIKSCNFNSILFESFFLFSLLELGLYIEIRISFMGFCYQAHSRIMPIYRNPPFPDAMDKSLFIYSQCRDDNNKQSTGMIKGLNE